MTELRAVVTGASDGIGRATALALAASGWHVTAVARRADLLHDLADACGATPVVADITSLEDIARLRTAVEADGALHTLVNNAGGARGLDRIEDADLEDWRWMYEVNVLGTQQVTAALLPALRRGAASERRVADILTVTSIAATETYPGGAGYNAAKFAQRALVEVLRQELHGEPIRVIEVAPGMVHTNFSLARFAGNQTRADAVYADVVDPLTADDIAVLIRDAVRLPAHINPERIVVKPVAQLSATQVWRHPLRVRTG